MATEQPARDDARNLREVRDEAGTLDGRQIPTGIEAVTGLLGADHAFDDRRPGRTDGGLRAAA